MSNLEREMFEIRRLAASTATLLQRHISAETMQEAAKQTEEMIRREHFRDGEPWTDFERDVLAEKLKGVTLSLSREFGRSENALCWAIWRMINKWKE